ncbi:hypothetical protein DICPUDRAFT_34840 [Dictyostelium purpureum]|uniref:Alpha-mannosidase n=1 Tax=Dictyostelium purpureum TaxID=5786 RepID=F0ZND5_DICPU|nr:uncharacterized protein DICPUDRAFT_34840 [Dictyostelium purpureum]EGC34543.1 hypothetical protein DICPUDRAFT_34840 [Dictyostelium purpureum]|eukprot:XP_003288919.1 hypothetical protein DICPUDRAFT_34840 [Dictyostelium purpureum]
MKFIKLILFVFLIIIVSSSNASKIKNKDNEVINAFLIPHSHCDVGWVETYDQYYTENVSVILDSVVHALINDPTKKFNWAEIIYFERWWNEQSSIIQAKVRDLVDRKQLYFIGGGWAQNDEATIHYEAVINQMTLGHQFLLSEFGVVPEIGWQIDPFGPSTLTATLFSLMGFKYHVINRIDERIKYVFNTTPDIPGSGYMSTEREFEFVWFPSPNNQDLSIFTHILDHHYSSPYLIYPNASNPNISLSTGFDFEGGADNNPSINETNINERACILVEIIQQRAALYRHNNVLLPFGNDFRYQNATLEFSNMDKLIEYINANSSFGVNLQYGTLNEYFEEVFKETDNSTKIFPELVATDYFVYTMCLSVDYQNFNTCANWWSGYYTSYPLLKGTVRESDSILRVGEMLYALASAYDIGFGSDFDFNIGFYALDFHRNVSGILTHHDATTGTAKAYVRENYFEMLYEAESLTMNYNVPHFVGYLLANQTINRDYTTNASLMAGAQVDDIFGISFTNSLGWDRSEFISIEMPSNMNVAVYDSNFNPIVSQVVQRQDKGGKWYLFYQVETPALGISTYFVVVLDIDGQITNPDLLSFISTNEKFTPIVSETTFSQSIDYDDSISSKPVVSIGNLLYNLNFNFDANNNNLLTLKSYDDLLRGQMAIPLSQQFIEYTSMSDDAYKFRPTGLPISLTPINPQFYLTSGPIVQLVTIIYNNNCSQTFFVYNSTTTNGHSSTNNSLISENQFFEIDNIVASGWDKEIAIRFTSSIQNSNKFYTNNGLEVMKREYQIRWNDTLPWSEIAGNFFPVVNTGYIVDEYNQLTLLTKQTVAGSSQGEGLFELLLIRRSNYTQWSVHEPMNDTSNPTIKVRVLFGDPNRIEQIRTPHSLLFENPLLPVFTQINEIGIEKWLSLYNTVFKPLKASLPYNLHLLTMTKQWMDSSVNIFRAINIYELGQSNDFSQPVNLSLQELLGNFNVSNIVETSLSANNVISSEKSNSIITLNPLQLKTYLLNLNSK